ncbi:MAG TPA: 4-carboxy-4-hydroxy-2-oxoadipate aldolase/oxaloacetate decarboxylase [Candidatus Acidoferrales bacterium]|nr:4-carboxy-4-hydroxy-2-oxoadipate aldolase/oxaloacetate decarboxylase [Candidatus Acidoferrales bacterium]
MATVYEAAGQQGLIHADLIQIVPGTSAAGPARTVRCGQGDNLAVHLVMERLEPGDILVLTMPEPKPVALVGELLILQAQAHGAAGVLVDASIRDRDELVRIGLPVWARWVRATGTSKREPGEIDVPVAVGGTTIEPGDVVVLDADGAVVVGRGRLSEVLRSAEARRAKEESVRPQLQAGELTADIYGFRGSGR